MSARLRDYPAPRWQTPLPPGVVDSWGPDVAAFGRDVLRIRWDRWQLRALNRALAVGADGRLAHRVYLISVGRQCGKTAIVRAVTGWALTARELPEWRTILGLAHDKKQARIPYRAVRADLAGIRRRVGPTSRGGLDLTAYLGIRSSMFGIAREYDVASREAADAIRGLSVDLGLFDEIRTQRGHDTWAALLPTTAARPEPLVLGISTAGNDRSVLLREWFDRGRRIIDGAEPADGFGMTWYAAPDELAPDDPAAWRASSPSIADRRLPLAAVRAELRSLSPLAFRQERLNLFTDAVEEWLPAGLWAELVADAPPGRELAERIVLGVEVVPTWRRASVTVSLATADGAYVSMAGELVAGRPGASESVAPDELVELVRRLVVEIRPTAITYSAAAAAAPYLEAMGELADVRRVPLGPRQLRAASELFRAELVGRRLRHADDPLLARQLRDSRPSAPIEGGAWYLSIKHSVGDVDAIRAAAWAAWVAIEPAALPPGPGIHV